ncbi:unnamed protein product [Rotaria sordida]|uniref:Uncharacterized protein n=1 Tax=Rotaria sordida TaxID=392033 RepID=A0A815MYA2_9BILA|nr:unnamed protein product [Rotaria sordida]CAF1429250.1 unnamed protein product [Rotaria sordida]
MVSQRFYLILILVMVIMPANSIHYAGTLTGRECIAYYASNNAYKNLQALFSCPKKWLIKSRKKFLM